MWHTFLSLPCIPWPALSGCSTHGGDRFKVNVNAGSGKRSDAGTIHVVLSSHLRDYTGGRNEFDVEGAPSVRSLIELLDSRFPGISVRLLDDQGNVRRYVNIFVDEQDIREREGLLTSLSGTREVVILPSVAGG